MLKRNQDQPPAGTALAIQPVATAMHPRSNLLHDSDGGEMLAPLVRQIPIEHIAPDPEQPRQRVQTDGPEWEGLLASVREHGVLQPILVQPRPDQRGQYIIVSGERRWQAAKVAHHSHITARVIKSDVMLARKVELQLVENALREGLSPLDELDACLRYLKSGHKRFELAEMLGVTPGRVSQILSLERIDPAVRSYIREHDLRLSRRKLSRVAARCGREAQMEFLECVDEPPTSCGDAPPVPIKFTAFGGSNFRFEMRPQHSTDHGGTMETARVSVAFYGVQHAGEVADALMRTAKLYRAKVLGA